MSISVLKFEDYVKLCRDRGQTQFASLIPPALLVRSGGADDASERKYSTVLAAEDERSGIATVTALGDVYPIVKRIGVVFPDRIGVGRAANVDVAMPLPRLSKYHAFFSLAADGVGYLLTDARSKNGTWLDGQQLTPLEPVALHDGARVRLGSYRFVFCTAAGFCRLAGRGKLDWNPGAVAW